ncbi:SDR family oxidoreductase [Streptomyces sp. NPDC097107]|uniref:SDR family oxidoreductase n=1 Tax=Streptomyces sp. NPDC097107 TaxID=3366089 RepID=UPI003819659F
MHHGVLVVIGTGRTGQAAARRMGSGRPVLLADEDGERLIAAGCRLEGDNFQVSAQRVDVSAPASVAALARRATTLGPVAHVVHTADLSPVQKDIRAVLSVDMLGVALVEEFGQVVEPGAAGVIIAGVAGHGYAPRLTAEERWQLRHTPARELPSLPVAQEKNFTDPGQAYGFAKCASHLRVQETARSWGARGARINTVSPGVLSAPIGQAEPTSPHSETMRTVLATSPVPRLGTLEDIAATTEFLLGPAAGFITGVDLLVDGGFTSVLADLPPAPHQ